MQGLLCYYFIGFVIVFPWFCKDGGVKDGLIAFLVPTPFWPIFLGVPLAWPFILLFGYEEIKEAHIKLFKRLFL